MFICFNRFSIVFMRFVLGLPLGFIVYLIASYNATLAGAFSYNLAICPKNRSLRCDWCTCSVYTLKYISVVLELCDLKSEIMQ